MAKEEALTMEETLRRDALEIAKAAIASCLPDEAVRRALAGRRFPRPVVLAAIGKAAWRMAKAAYDRLGAENVARGMVITKYGHSQGPIGHLAIREAGHPIVDRQGIAAAGELLQMVESLGAEDTVLLLLSGGGSALFELPLIPLAELADINRQLLSRGASIEEVNAVRKRLSAVKGGRFGERCAPARVLSVILSDVLGDRPDVIASGPAVPDLSTCGEAAAVAARYSLRLSAQAARCLEGETPKALPNAEAVVTGGVARLCREAEEGARQRGYRTLLLADCLDCQAKEAGRFLAAVARTMSRGLARPTAVIAGGETVVELKGKGLGGRNQELALAAAEGLSGLEGAALLAIGSDGTDGPTDAAGGLVDGGTAGILRGQGLSIPAILAENNAYYGLERCGGLVRTGPTGTNVNDLCLLLLGGGQGPF